MFLQFLFD